MPSPKYKARKPRPRPNVTTPGDPSFAGTPVMKLFLAPDVDGITDLFDVQLFFGRNLGPVPFDEPSLHLRDQSNNAMSIDSTGYGYDPVTAAPDQLDVLMIRANGTGARVQSLIYTPPGYVVGEDDGSGIPIGVRMYVTTMTFSP